MPDHNDVLRRSHIERLDVADDVVAEAEAVDEKAMVKEASSGDDLLESTSNAKAIFASMKMREFDRVTSKQVKAEAAALRQADPASIRAIRDIDIAEQRAKKDTP